MNMAINFKMVHGFFPGKSHFLFFAVSWLRNLLPLSLINCLCNLRVQKLQISKETQSYLNFLKVLIGIQANEYFGCLRRTDTFRPTNIFYKMLGF